MIIVNPRFSTGSFSDIKRGCLTTNSAQLRTNDVALCANTMFRIDFTPILRGTMKTNVAIDIPILKYMANI